MTVPAGTLEALSEPDPEWVAKRAVEAGGHAITAGGYSVHCTCGYEWPFGVNALTTPHMVKEYGLRPETIAAHLLRAATLDAARERPSDGLRAAAQALFIDPVTDQYDPQGWSCDNERAEAIRAALATPEARSPRPETPEGERLDLIDFMGRMGSTHGSLVPPSGPYVLLRDVYAAFGAVEAFDALIRGYRAAITTVHNPEPSR
jgi:hypothetical protein